MSEYSYIVPCCSCSRSGVRKKAFMFMHAPGRDLRPQLVDYLAQYTCPLPTKSLSDLACSSGQLAPGASFDEVFMVRI